MLKRTVTAIVGACALSLVLSGCIVHTKRHPRRNHQTVKSKRGDSKRCHPSEYWDGRKCRHKGKGKGRGKGRGKGHRKHRH